MEVLQEGSTGPDVQALQIKLKQLGFSPGAIDGNMGPGTQAAVIAFQKSEGLLADGVVGARTATALRFTQAEVPPPPAMPNVSVAMVAKMFPNTHLDHIVQNLPSVLSALADAQLTTVPIVLASLATIRAETEGFVPISEGVSRYNTSPGGQAFDLYDNRKDLGNMGPTDGADFCGRGYIQLTGRTNYEKFGPVVGVADLAVNPEKANDPQIAARILAAFVRAKETAIKDAILHNDLATARRLVNGGSNGLDRFSDAYRIGANLLM